MHIMCIKDLYKTPENTTDSVEESSQVAGAGKVRCIAKGMRTQRQRQVCVSL
jgi:hypothetical protein